MVAVVVAAVVGTVVAFNALSSGGKRTGSTTPSSQASVPSSTPPSSASPATPATPAGCNFVKTPEEPAPRPVGLPANANPPRQGTVAVTVTTNQGVLPVILDRSKAPCTVENFLSLANAGFYNNTPCHRLVTLETLKVLQCGDPTGTGKGGPGYTIPDEPPTGLKPSNAGAAVYPRGTVAMAKTAAPNSGGSQFFLVYADSQLSPDYTIFGTVAEPGIKVLEKIAAGGVDSAGATEPGDGKPKLAITLQSVTIAKP